MGRVLYDIVSIRIDQSGGSEEGLGSVLDTMGSWSLLTQEVSRGGVWGNEGVPSLLPSFSLKIGRDQRCWLLVHPGQAMN